MQPQEATSGLSEQPMLGYRAAGAEAVDLRSVRRWLMWGMLLYGVVGLMSAIAWQFPQYKYVHPWMAGIFSGTGFSWFAAADALWLTHSKIWVSALFSGLLVVTAGVALMRRDVWWLRIGAWLMLLQSGLNLLRLTMAGVFYLADPRHIPAGDFTFTHASIAVNSYAGAITSCAMWLLVLWLLGRVTWNDAGYACLRNAARVACALALGCFAVAALTAEMARISLMEVLGQTNLIWGEPTSTWEEFCGPSLSIDGVMAVLRVAAMAAGSVICGAAVVNWERWRRWVLGAMLALVLLGVAEVFVELGKIGMAWIWREGYADPLIAERNVLALVWHVFIVLCRALPSGVVTVMMLLAWWVKGRPREG